MEQDQPDLEEGEIEDDEVDTYTPLERPQTYAMDAPQKRFQEVDPGTYSDSDDEVQSSESDSDSDTGPHHKKAKKVKVTPKPLKRQNEKLKKYDIWSTRAQEDVLAETMISCDVTTKDRSRDVETYDFSLARKYYEELESKQGQKRTRDDMKNVNFRIRKRSPSEEKVYKGKAKILPELSVDANSNTEDIVKEIANKLSEEREDLILKIVEIIGKKRTIEIYDKTKEIESEGGMPILNMSRRRTPGGVFLYLVRNDYHITQEQRQEIFTEEKQKYNRMIKEKRKQKVQKLKAATNSERSKILPELLSRAEIFSKHNPIRQINESDEANCTNPPPSPETDNHESCDGMESSQSLPNEPVLLNSNEDIDATSSRGKLKTYDDDFLDIGCDNEMDLF